MIASVSVAFCFGIIKRGILSEILSLIFIANIFKIKLSNSKTIKIPFNIG